MSEPKTSFPVKKALLISLGALLFKLCVFFGAYFLVQNQGREPNLCAWDCPFYREIATEGYSYKENVQGALAFFPLHPLLNKFIMSLVPGLSFEVSSVILNLLLYGTFSFLFLLWCFETGIKLYWLPLIFMTLDRFTLWAMVPYTEALFVNIMMIFLLIQKRWPESPIKYLIAALVGGIGSAVRIVGVSFVGAMGLSKMIYFLRRPFLGALCLLLGLSGVMAYFSYVHFTLGSWDLSLKTTATWGRKFSLFGILNSIYYLVKQFYFPTILTWLATLWFIVRPPQFLKINSTERWLMGLLIFIPMANTVPLGVSRYFSILIFGPLAFSYVMVSLKDSYRWLRYVIALIFLAEIYWQVHLLQKFFRVEVFSWAG